MKFIDFEKLAALFLKYWDKFLIDGVSYTLALAAITVAFGAVFGHFERKMKKADRNNGYGRKRKQQREVHI